MYMVPHTTLHLCNCIGRIDKLFANITNDFNQSAVSALYIRAGLPLSVGRTNNRTSWQYNWPTCTLISRTFSAWQRLVNKRTEQRNHETGDIPLCWRCWLTGKTPRRRANRRRTHKPGNRMGIGRPRGGGSARFSSENICSAGPFIWLAFPKLSAATHQPASCSILIAWPGSPVIRCVLIRLSIKIKLGFILKWVSVANSMQMAWLACSAVVTFFKF